MNQPQYWMHEFKSKTPIKSIYWSWIGQEVILSILEIHIHSCKSFVNHDNKYMDQLFTESVFSLSKRSAYASKLVE